MPKNFLRHLSLILIPVSLFFNVYVTFVAVLVFLLTSKLKHSWPFWTPSYVLIASALLAALVGWHLDGFLASLRLGGVVLIPMLFATRLRTSDLQFLGLGVSLVSLTSLPIALKQIYMDKSSQALLFTSHPNIAGAMLLCSILAECGFGFYYQSRIWRLIFGLSAACGLIALAYTGSRSAFLGLLAATGLLLGFLFLSVSRLVKSIVLIVALIIGLGLWFINSSDNRNLDSLNLISNASFELNRLGYQWGAAVLQSTETAFAGQKSVFLEHKQVGYEVLLATDRDILVDDRRPYVLSMWVQPLPAMVEDTFVRVEAFDREDVFLGRVALDGWAQGNENQMGGPFILPVFTDERLSWQRLVIKLPDLPLGTNKLRWMIVNQSQSIGVYGYIDALQLETSTTATDFVLGPSLKWEVFLGPMIPRLLRLLNPLEASGGRIPIWLLSLEMASKKPFLGYGFRSNELLQEIAPRLIASNLTHPHNTFLQLLLDGGSLTLIAFMGWWGSILLFLFKRRNILAIFALALSVAMLVANFFDISLYSNSVYLMYAFIMGSALSSLPEDGS